MLHAAHKQHHRLSSLQMADDKQFAIMRFLIHPRRETCDRVTNWLKAYKANKSQLIRISMKGLLWDDSSPMAKLKVPLLRDQLYSRPVDNVPAITAHHKHEIAIFISVSRCN